MTKRAFVIMPFSTTPNNTANQWTDIYHRVFAPPLEEMGYHCERASPLTGNLIDSIIDKIYTADVLLADITDRNANVFYELGIRHSLRKGTIIVCRDGQSVPSDLQSLWCVNYGLVQDQIAKFQLEVGRILRLIEADPEKSDNPVSDYLERGRLSISRLINRTNLKKLSALFTELTGNNVVLTGGPLDGVRVGLFSFGCLDMLLQTLYIDPGPDVLAFAYELRSMLKRIEAGDLNRELIGVASFHCLKLAEKVNSLRETVMRGSFKEPTVVSVMMWLPPSADTNLLLYFSRIGAFEAPNWFHLMPKALEQERVAQRLELDTLCKCGSGRSFAACPRHQEHIRILSLSATA